MARAGQVVILRHNKPADPDTFKGVYRIRLPLPTDPARPIAADAVAADADSPDA